MASGSVIWWESGDTKWKAVAGTTVTTEGASGGLVSREPPGLSKALGREQDQEGGGKLLSHRPPEVPSDHPGGESENGQLGGAPRVVQSVERPTSAQVMISWSVSSSPASGSVLTARSLERVLDSVSPSLCPSPTHALSLSVSEVNKH